MEGWKFWWGVVAFALGGVATQFNGWLTYRRQRKDKLDDAADALRQRREEFELQHLVEFNGLVRVASDKLIEYHGVVRHNRLLGVSPNDAQAAQGRADAGSAFEAALSNVTAQLGFVLSDPIRFAAAGMVGYMVQQSALVDVGESLDVIALAHRTDEVYIPLGDRVREIYAGQAIALVPRRRRSGLRRSAR
ncbi:hypothetical protein [Streptomyces sp. NPDC006552]|uniref:hypothetical protein n=1 Tax=Streptomyces sp. NPDC006552 TaxID=3157179 RepID=UPI0033B5159B